MPSPASPGTNRFRRESCGRWFTTEEEFRNHRVECEAAERSGRTGPKRHLKPEEEEISKARPRS